MGGGSKTVFGEGFYGMFSPPLSFPPPLFFSEKKQFSRILIRNMFCLPDWGNFSLFFSSGEDHDLPFFFNAKKRAPPPPPQTRVGAEPSKEWEREKAVNTASLLGISVAMVHAACHLKIFSQ